MDAPVEGEHEIRWLILIYHLPRDPSRHRVAVWRKLEWLQLRVREAGGEATLWKALLNTSDENINLVEEFCALREAAYRELIDGAGKLERKAALGAGGTVLFEELARIECDFRTECRRDYFKSPLRRRRGVS